ncbi:hypothetical protein NQZ68_012780 [Dissostichus eleginoides]|nr:hypothetical protein NQZ68_012780 [Dissostichus eleginoides]
MLVPTLSVGDPATPSALQRGPFSVQGWQGQMAGGKGRGWVCAELAAWELRGVGDVRVGNWWITPGARQDGGGTAPEDGQAVTGELRRTGRP